MESRPAKRTRQACEPCRRKKSRCPGEKPKCSFCVRLNQKCKYSDDWESSAKSGNVEQLANSAWEDRFENLEAKVDLVLNRILSPPVTQPREPSNLLTSGPKTDELLLASTQQPTIHVPPPAYESRSRNDLQSSGISLPPHTIVGLVETYIRRCDCQPLSIFDVENLRSTSDSYKPEVLLSILALALRFSDSNQVPGDSMQLALQYAERTRQIVMQKVIEENVEMSTLQALCLQAFFDITSGNAQRAWLSIGIGMRLITSVQMPLKPEVPFDQAAIDEYRRCFWGFYMLECLCSDASKSRLSLPHEKPPFPPSLSVKSAHGPPTVLRKFGDYSPGRTQDKGIIGYSFQLVELWKDSLQYVLGSLNSSEVPWSSGSGYFDMSASVMEWETYLCQNHRSAHAMFSEQSPTDLLMNTRYWGPWLNVQFTYHGTLCLINNPFWLFEKVKSNAGMAPTSFLETASDLALLHAKHIARLIETLGNRNFESSDPFLGYCAAIACITHLWYCHVEDRSVKDQAQARFAICYGFVAKLGCKWPNVQIIANNLVTIKKRALAWKPSSAPPFTALEIPSSDLTLIWTLLSYPVRNISKETSKGIFSASHLFGSTAKEVTNVKLNQIPAYAPDVPAPTSNLGQSPTPPSPNPPESRKRNAQVSQLDDLGWDMFNDPFNGESQAFDDDASNWWNTGNL